MIVTIKELGISIIFKTFQGKYLFSQCIFVIEISIIKTNEYY